MTKDEFEQLHGRSPLTTIEGFDPSRDLVRNHIHMCLYIYTCVLHIVLHHVSLACGCVTVHTDKNICCFFLAGPGIYPDVMHITHLALAPDAICSLLLDYTDKGFLEGNSRDARFPVLYDMYRAWCESEGIRDRAARKLFTAKYLQPAPGKFPEPSQRQLSATAARYMLLWASSLAQSVTHQFGHAPHRQGCIGALACMEVIMAREPRIMSPQACAELERAYLTYRACADTLAREACQGGLFRWHLRPKCHMLGHAVYMTLPRNLRHSANYSDEDFVFRAKTLAQKAHPRYMSRHTLERYAIHACMRWQSQRKR